MAGNHTLAILKTAEGYFELAAGLKNIAQEITTLTYSEGCCCLFRILCSIICPHKLSIQPMT